MQAVDPDLPLFSIQTMDDILAQRRWPLRMFGTMFAIFALIALLLAAVGLYGVMAYAVTQRTQEIGVRMAIGAGRWNVAWLFLRKGLAQIAVALLIGLPAAFGFTLLARFQLVAIEGNDPLTMIAITVVISVVALVACVLPAAKAAQVDPITALRSE